MPAGLARGGEFRTRCRRATAPELLSGDRRGYEDLVHRDGGTLFRKHLEEALCGETAIISCSSERDH